MESNIFLETLYKEDVIKNLTEDQYNTIIKSFKEAGELVEGEYKLLDIRPYDLENPNDNRLMAILGLGYVTHYIKRYLTLNSDYTRYISENNN